MERILTVLVFYHLWDKNSLYLKIKSGSAFKLYINVGYVKAFNFQNFNQDGNENANLKKRILQSSKFDTSSFPVKENV